MEMSGRATRLYHAGAVYHTSAKRWTVGHIGWYSHYRRYDGAIDPKQWVADQKLDGSLQPQPGQKSYVSGYHTYGCKWTADQLIFMLDGKEWGPGLKLGDHTRFGGKKIYRNYPFYLAFENSIDVDYVSEKVFHALEAGTLPVYLGASNVKDFVPHRSVVELRDHGSAEALAAYLKSLLDDPALYDSYFEWKRRPLPDAFVSKFGFVATHAKCRLCRWAYATRYGYTWDQRRQIISDLPER